MLSCSPGSSSGAGKRTQNVSQALFLSLEAESSAVDDHDRPDFDFIETLFPMITCGPPAVAFPLVWTCMNCIFLTGFIKITTGTEYSIKQQLVCDIGPSSLHNICSRNVPFRKGCRHTSPPVVPVMGRQPISDAIPGDVKKEALDVPHSGTCNKQHSHRS